MPRNRFSLLLIAGLVAAAPVVAAGTPARADDWGGPTVDFVAEMVFRNGAGQTRKARLYYTADKQRLEYLAGQEPIALLVDKTAKKSWLLLLNRRQYQPVPFVPPDYFLGVSNPASKRRKVGDETLLGKAVGRYEVSAKTRQGDSFDGVAWITAQRIVVRLEGTAQRGRRKQKIAMTMTELTIGPVEADLLQLPKGYKALPPAKPKR
jgi:hypothetical protein